jgi:hypothetical protein
MMITPPAHRQVTMIAGQIHNPSRPLAVTAHRSAMGPLSESETRRSV